MIIRIAKSMVEENVKLSKKQAKAGKDGSVKLSRTKGIWRENHHQKSRAF
jgi:hypothetical protein